MVARPAPRPWLLGTLALLALGVACELPSSGVDPNELYGVFDGARPSVSGSASASASSSGSASASAAPSVSALASAPPPTVVLRRSGEPGCVAEKGTPAAVRRTVGRPACRGADVLEWRDPTSTPRYGCVYGMDRALAGDPLPLVVFFHGTAPVLDDPSALAKLTAFRDRLDDAVLGARPGFVVLGVQGRAIEGSDTATFDTSHVSSDNLDKLAVDHFVDELIARKAADPRRIYALGIGRGGTMAITYGMLRADRVAATAAFAPWIVSAEWQCPTPAPPVRVLYRACDGLIACDAIEGWLREREASGAVTPSVRLGDGAREEPSCATRQQCTPKRSVASHHRWPKGREDDVLRFFAGYATQ